MFSFFKKQKIPEFPESVELEQVTPVDEEVLEEWYRVCRKEHAEFYGLSALKVDDSNFPWYLYFSAGEFIREEPYANQLASAIWDAINALPGAREAHREDTEKFVIAGDVNGGELITTVSHAIDTFMKKELANWKDSLKT